MCLDLASGPAHAFARRTNLLLANQIATLEHRPNQQVTGIYELVPCPNSFKTMETLTQREEYLKENVFYTRQDDYEISLSCEDRKFLEIMESSVHKNESGNLEMPLPFRQKNVKMPNNHVQAVNRLYGLLCTLKKKPQMEKDYFTFMEKILCKGHASPVPPDKMKPKERPGELWYLPHFGVYHPKKPTQIRVVFDSSAEYEGVSLNKELLPGPDMMNSLLGVLRENPSICPTSSGKSKKFFFSDFAHGRKFCNVLNTIYQGTVYL